MTYNNDIPQESLFNDSNNDMITIITTDKQIDFCLTFNTGNASIFTYIKDMFLNEYTNQIDAIDEYEKEINGVIR